MIEEDINDQKANFVKKKTTFHPIKFFCEKGDGHENNLPPS